jgi:hypothetical protein
MENTVFASQKSKKSFNNGIHGYHKGIITLDKATASAKLALNVITCSVERP